MEWKGRQLDYSPAMMTTYHRCDTPEGGAGVHAAYRQETPHADENIGYWRHYSPERRAVASRFCVSHQQHGTADTGGSLRWPWSIAMEGLRE